MSISVCINHPMFEILVGSRFGTFGHMRSLGRTSNKQALNGLINPITVGVNMDLVNSKGYGFV